jgi:glyoxylase-like metal-dependent hydrolase (beta-lactamase superfamily II)
MIPNLSNHSISAARLQSRRFTPARRARRFVKGMLASFALLATCVVHAAAPMALTNPPGFYRVMLGRFEVTALSDGTMPGFDVQKLLTNNSVEATGLALEREFLTGKVEGSSNAYLINTGSKLVLIDTGAGRLFGPTLGRLPENLRASGYRAEQVDAVIITHMHPDHVGGLMAAGRMAFPNATIHADRREAAFWLSQTNLDAAPEANKDFFKGAMASVNPYVQAGKFKPFDGASELVPGIRVQPAPGHTAGHSFVVVESDAQKLVLWGDLIHAAAVQFPHPEVTIAFDGDPQAAATQRWKAFAEAAREGYLIGAAHISFPGLGRVRPDGAAYRWVPVQYGVLR